MDSDIDGSNTSRKGRWHLSSARRQLLVLLISTSFVYWLSSKLDLSEWLIDVLYKYENSELDETITAGLFLVVGLAVFALRRWKDAAIARRQAEEQYLLLQRAMGELKQLKGIVPICASCKNIRDKDGFWHHVEEFVSEHSEAQFSHGICPTCMNMLYPGYQYDDDSYDQEKIDEAAGG